MPDFSAAFRVRKMNSGNPVVYLLREQYGTFAGSANKADPGDSIADSLRQLGQVGEAARWYEAAGILMYGGAGCGLNCGRCTPWKTTRRRWNAIRRRATPRQRRTVPSFSAG